MPKSRSILFSAFVLLLGIETSNANVIVESRDEQPQNSALTNLNENLELAANGGRPLFAKTVRFAVLLCDKAHQLVRFQRPGNVIAQDSGDAASTAFLKFRFA